MPETVVTHADCGHVPPPSQLPMNRGVSSSGEMNPASGPRAHATNATSATAALDAKAASRTLGTKRIRFLLTLPGRHPPKR